MKYPNATKLRAAAFCCAALLSAAAAAEIPAPKPYYGEIAARLADVLPVCHVLGKNLDDSLSQKAWTNLFSAYDPTHSVFLREDLERFEYMRTRYDDAMRTGDVSFAYDVYAAYTARMASCMDFTTNLAASAAFSFPEGETLLVKRKDAPWPADEAERRAIWEKRVKNDVLAQAVSRRLDAEKKVAAGKEPASKFAPGSDEFFAESVEIARTNVLKRYVQLARVSAEPDDDAILQKFLGAAATAYDPHTDYFSPDQNEDFNQSMSLSLCGVGAVLQMDDGALKITEIMPGGPIDRDKRIKRGDKIVGVGQGENGEIEDIRYRPTNKSIRKIRGPKGTKVTLQFIPRSDPDGVTLKTVTLVRDEIKLEDEAASGRVEYIERDGAKRKLGYIQLPGFYGTMDRAPGAEGYRSCTDDVRRELAKLDSQGVEGLVFDLRGNGGGALREAIDMMSLFIRGGPVVQVRETGSVRVYRCDSSDSVFDKPMVVLIDRGSASASEIVAAALQDYKRAIVVGDFRSHGKGTVQGVIPLGAPKFGTVKITTSRFYRVNGSSTQIKGVESDIVLPSILAEMDTGEDKLPNALPWTRISAVPYRGAWNLTAYADRLAAASKERIAGDERWKRHLKAVSAMHDIVEREYVPLGREARLALMRADREAREENSSTLASLIAGEDDPLSAEDDADVEDSASEDEAAPDGAEPAGGESKNRHRRRFSTIPEDDDIVLEEAFRILADLVDMTGGSAMRGAREKPRSALQRAVSGDFL